MDEGTDADSWVFLDYKDADLAKTGNDHDSDTDGISVISESDQMSELKTDEETNNPEIIGNQIETIEDHLVDNPGTAIEKSSEIQQIKKKSFQESFYLIGAIGAVTLSLVALYLEPQFNNGLKIIDGYDDLHDHDLPNAINDESIDENLDKYLNNFGKKIDYNKINVKELVRKYKRKHSNTAENRAETDELSVCTRKLAKLKNKEEYLLKKEKELNKKQFKLEIKEKEIREKVGNLKIDRKKTKNIYYNKRHKKIVENDDIHRKIHKHFLNKQKKNDTENSSRKYLKKSKKNGHWYTDMHNERENLRKKSRVSDWIFERANYRDAKRNKAHWYFQWMINREDQRSL